MALFHLNVTQIKRSKGQSAIAAAAYRSGEKYKAEHAHDMKRYYEARRIISLKFPDGKFDRKSLETEYAELEQQHEVTYAEFQKIRAESQQLWKIKSHIDTARKAMGYSLEHQPKKQEQEI